MPSTSIWRETRWTKICKSGFWWNLMNGLLSRKMIFWFVCTIDGRVWAWVGFWHRVAVRMFLRKLFSASLHHLQDSWSLSFMKSCSSCRGRCCWIDRTWSAVVPCGHRLRHRLARSSLSRPRTPVFAATRTWNRRNHLNSMCMSSSCCAWSPCRHHRRRAWDARLSVLRWWNMSGGDFSATAGALNAFAAGDH